jgi:hypothetical protein
MQLNIKINEYGDFPEGFDYEAFQAIWPRDIKRTDDAWPEHWYDISHTTCRLNGDEIQELTEMGVKFEIVPFPGAMVVKMKKSNGYEPRQKPTFENFQTGQAVQISIPDIGLLHVNEVCVLDDICTDVLQDHLNEGWRILAVCPPNAARRPDYILGRTSRND